MEGMEGMEGGLRKESLSIIIFPSFFIVPGLSLFFDWTFVDLVFDCLID